MIVCAAASKNVPTKVTAAAGDDDEWGDDIDEEDYSKLDLSDPNITDTGGSPSKTSKPSATSSATSTSKSEVAEKDNSFREYRKLCAEIAEESSYNGKTAILARFLEKGSTGGMIFDKLIKSKI